MKNCLVRIPAFGLLRTTPWTMAVSLGAIVFSLWVAEMPKAWAKCWTVSGATFCDNRESTGGGGGGTTRDYDRDDRRAQRQEEERLRQERNARYDAIHQQASDAWGRGDYREALRLYHQQKALRDGPNVQVAIVRSEAMISWQDAIAADTKGNSETAVSLYRRAIARGPELFTKDNIDYVDDLEARLKKEREAEAAKRELADRERRHRPEVERLRAEAKAIMDIRPGDALAKLDAALKLLPGDSKTTGDWWLAKANLDLREGKYDEAIQALQNAQSFAGDSPEVARVRTRVADERSRQGVSVQNAFDDLRQRLAAEANAETVDDAFGTKKANPTLTPADARKIGSHSSAGVQAKSVERHSSEAKLLRDDGGKTTAGLGFDDTGQHSGNLVYPDKNKHQQVPPSALDKQIPGGAKDDPAIKEMQAWYRSLDARKAEKEEMIANIKEEQKTSKDPILDVKIATLTNDVRRLNDDQAKATATVKERVEVIKKQMLDKGLAWDESPSSATTQTPAPANAPTSQSSSSKLDFIRD